MEQNKLEYFAALLEHDQIERMIKSNVGCDANIISCKVKIIPGAKYTKVNIGTSGRYMLDHEGYIYGTKAYGVIHRGHVYGTLDTVNDWFWGEYTAFPRRDIPLPSELMTVEKVLEQRGAKLPEKPAEEHKPAKPINYEQLTADLKAAIEASDIADDGDDGGTCNFDAPALSLPRWNSEKTLKAIQAAGLSAFEWNCYKTKYLVLSVHGAGQGNSRTLRAEAMGKYLKMCGYDTTVYYQMD